jgi:pyridoxine kinase
MLLNQPFNGKMEKLGGNHMQNVLTIAGSDSLAGGGLQADLKTFEELNVFGLSATTSIANIFPDDVSIKVLDPELVKEQLDSVLTQVPIAYAKTGLLGSVAMIELVKQELEENNLPLVVDPVLVFKEGETAEEVDYLAAMKNDLLPLASVTTPNLTEAEQLSGLKIESIGQLPQAAQRIQDLGCPNVIIKGGSRLSGNEAVDYLLTEKQGYWFRNNKIDTAITNGAGCTFSAAITAFLAQEKSVVDAVKMAKEFVRLAIIHGVTIGDSGSVWQGATRQQEDHHAKKSN